MTVSQSFGISVLRKALLHLPDQVWAVFSTVWLVATQVQL